MRRGRARIILRERLRNDYQKMDNRARTRARTRARIRDKMPLNCPCHSNRPYAECCEPFHKGALPINALLLMRSRYSAYALKLFDYIIATTDLNNPNYQSNIGEWKKEILEFCLKTEFQGLKILEFLDGETEAFVTFHAILKEQTIDKSFIEKSAFLKKNGRWFYWKAVSLSSIE